MSEKKTVAEYDKDEDNSANKLDSVNNYNSIQQKYRQKKEQGVDRCIQCMRNFIKFPWNGSSDMQTRATRFENAYNSFSGSLSFAFS